MEKPRTTSIGSNARLNADHCRLMPIILCVDGDAEKFAGGRTTWKEPWRSWLLLHTLPRLQLGSRSRTVSIVRLRGHADFFESRLVSRGATRETRLSTVDSGTALGRWLCCRANWLPISALNAPRSTAVAELHNRPYVAFQSCDASDWQREGGDTRECTEITQTE
jgi:hypothetical protein